jgi:Na+/H+ antiporter NhaD/arsenite permease-like protein
VLTIALAATSFRARQPLAAAGALVGGLVSIGCMVVINFMIDSDFKWELSAVAAVWACAMAAYWLERGRRGH